MRKWQSKCWLSVQNAESAFTQENGCIYLRKQPFQKVNVWEKSLRLHAFSSPSLLSGAKTNRIGFFFFFLILWIPAGDILLWQLFWSCFVINTFPMMLPTSCRSRNKQVKVQSRPFFEKLMMENKKADVLRADLSVHQQPDGEGHVQAALWLDLNQLHVGIIKEGAWSERRWKANVSVMVGSANRSPVRQGGGRQTQTHQVSVC